LTTVAGVAADPDVVAVALYKAPRTGLGWEKLPSLEFHGARIN
jgi:hypothetical protein